MLRNASNGAGEFNTKVKNWNWHFKHRPWRLIYLLEEFICIYKTWSWNKWNDTKIWLPLCCCHSPTLSEGDPVHHRQLPFQAMVHVLFFFILMKIKYWAQSWVFQINGEWKALAIMWGRKKKKTITTALLVQQSQTAGFPAGGLLACIISTL